MNTVDKVINVALNEVGYLEKSASAYKKDPSVLDRPKDGAGSDNYTKYGRDMHNLYPSVMDFPAYWCDCFVDWCFQKAYGVSNAKALLGGNFDDYTVSSAQLYKNKGAYDKNPRVGDQVFFRNNTRICHTGIVYKVDAEKIYTIEGNTSNSAEVVANGGCVAKKSYYRTNSKIDGYGHPKYDVATTPTTTTTVSSQPATAFKEYMVKCTTDLNVRAGNSTSNAILGVLYKGHKFTIREEKDGWGRVHVIADSSNKTIKGWVSLKYVSKI